MRTARNKSAITKSKHNGIRLVLVSMSKYNIYQMLSSLPCHFTWEQLQLQNVGRTVQMNIKNLEEHIEESIQGTEVESYNLMGFYKTQEKSFIEARRYFNKAVEKTKKEDEKIVSFACLVWLTWKEDFSSQDQILEKVDEVKRMFRGRDVNNIPEVMAEKAFSIANSGFTESSFQEALVCINRALTERPDNVMFKFTKVFVMQQLHQVRKKHVNQHDTTVDEIKQLWDEIIETLKDCPGLSVMYGKALIQYALLLAKINRYDNGSSGKKYAEKAEEVASSNHGVMRNVATFYINTTRGQQVSKLEKAEVILKKIVKEKKSKAVYKERSQLGQLLLKKYKIKPNEEKIFVEARDCLRESWDVNKKYITSALDLSRLYQEKYNKTKEITALVEAEKILFKEMFSYSGELDETNKAHFYTGYANFLKKYGPMLASHHQKRAKSILNDGMTAESETTDDSFEQVLKLLHQYADDQDDTKLLEAEKKFREMYEKSRDPYQARFHKEYGMFLEKYSKDLAFYYLKESLQYNPHQRREYSYIHLESLAEEKIASRDTEEQRKGYEALELMKRLQQN